MSSFPGDTCEPIQKNAFIQQPYSAMVNLISIVILCIFATQSSSIQVSSVLFFLILFQMIHMVSHSWHRNGSSQAILVHMTAYGILFTTWWTLQTYARIAPSLAIILLWLFLFGLDLMMLVLGAPTLYLILSVVVLFLLLFFMYRKVIVNKKNGLLIYWLMGSIILTIGLIGNEALHCQKMLKWKPLPYHVLVEMAGMLVFVLFSMLLIKMSSHGKK